MWFLRKCVFGKHYDLCLMNRTCQQMDTFPGVCQWTADLLFNFRPQTFFFPLMLCCVCL